METVTLHDGALTARAVVGGAAQTVLVSGAVTAVAALLVRAGPVETFGWLVALAAVGWTAAALRAARYGEGRPGEVRAAGWWATTFLVASTLAVTSWDLYVRMLVVLLALVVLGLRLTALADPQRPRAAGTRVVHPPAPGVRSAGAA